jgi:hypothetical protein
MKVNEKKVAEFVQSLLVKMGAASRSYKFMKEGVTVDGVKVFTEADDFAEDVEVFVEIDGAVSPAPDGDHTLEDGTKITVSGGKITAIEKVEEAPVEAELSDEAKAQIETALSAIAKDRDKYAAELTAKNDAISKLSADLTSRDKQITDLKAQVLTLSKQIGSVQDAPASAKTKAADTDDNGRPKSWAKMNSAERYAWNKENLTLNSKPN